MAKKKTKLKKVIPREKPLNERQIRFAREYCIDQNGSAAARRAGYAVGSADAEAVRLLKHPGIKKLVKKLQKETAAKIGVTVEMIAEEYRKVAFANMLDYVDEGNEIADVSKLSRNKAVVVESIKKTVTEFDGGSKTSVQIKLHSKLSALESLGRHLGFFEKDNSQKKTIINVGFDE